jgi:hypothetical protein
MAIINSSFSFVFVHVPKAAGTSITSSLSRFTNYCDLEIGGTEFGESVQPAYRKRFGLAKHSPAREIRNLMGAVAWSRSFTFSFVRNPFDRCYSTYHFLRKWESPNQSFNARMRAFGSFEDYVNSDVWAHGNGPDEIFRPQAYWLLQDMNSRTPMVDFVGRVENIQDDMRQVFEAIGLKKAMHDQSAVPTLNKSTNSRHDWHDSSEVIERIVKKYEMDFELFGYPRSPLLDPECAV